MKILWLLLAVGCSGEPFTYVESESKKSAWQDPQETQEEGGAPENPDSTPGGSRLVGGAENLGGAGGESPSGEPELVSTWKCRTDGNVCQCYLHDVFEPGWLNSASCADNSHCTIRDKEACVCWATEQDAMSALSTSGTELIRQCPPH